MTGTVPPEVVAYRRERVAEWTRAGVSATEIAARLGITYRSVVRHRQATGVTQPRSQFLTPEQLACAEQLLNDGCSVSETARTIGCCDRTIARHFPGRGWTREQVREYLTGARRMKALERKVMAQ